MDENLLGYLLNSLDLDEQRRVEEHLRTHPDALAKLERLRQSLAPLSADTELPSAPPSLVLGTLARVAEFQCRPPLPPPPQTRLREPAARDWRWLLRPDLLVAAVLLLAVAGLATTAINYTRHQGQIVSCSNNLRLWWNALEQYSALPANAGRFPRVESEGPRSIAGIFVPLLQDASLLRDVSVGCPAVGVQAPSDMSAAQLDKMYEQNPSAFRDLAPALAKDYAYSLGFYNNQELCGLRRDSGDLLPILADRPPSGLSGASPNHGGRGQNVLYIDGHVNWCTERNVGVNLDDIYVNRKGQLNAGLDLNDTVLAPSEASPAVRRSHGNAD